MIQRKPHMAREIDERGHDFSHWDDEPSNTFSMKG